MEHCQKQSAKKLKKGEKISLDVYLDFFFSNHQFFFTVDCLEQITRMHGYRRIRAPKQEVTKVISTIDLVNPCRSTLKESVSSTAAIPLEDLILDLQDLNWQECCVTSVLTFNPWKQNPSGSNLDNQESRPNQNAHESENIGEVDAIDGISSYCASEKPGKKLGHKNKKRKTAVHGSGMRDSSLDPSCFSSVSLSSS